MEVKYLFFRDRQMLCDIFEQFTLHGINYAVARNYRNLPDNITGDIDLIISRYHFVVAAEIVKKVSNVYGWKVFVEYDGEFAYHLGIQNHERYPDRFYLLIEFFDGGTWRGLRYYDTHKMLKTRRQVESIFCLDPKVEAFYTLTHHLLYNKSFPEKYQYLWDFLPKWRQRKYLDFRSYPLLIMFSIVASIKIQKYNVLAYLVRTYLVVMSLSLNPRQQLKNLKSLRKKIQSKPKGIILSMEGDEKSKYQLSNDIIEYAKKYHITIPPMKKSYVLEDADLRKVQKIVRSGGLAIINNRDLYQNNEFIKRNIDQHIFIDMNLNKITYFHNQCRGEINNIELANLDLLWRHLIKLLKEMRA